MRRARLAGPCGPGAGPSWTGTLLARHRKHGVITLPFTTSQRSIKGTQHHPASEQPKPETPENQADPCLGAPPLQVLFPAPHGALRKSEPSLEMPGTVAAPAARSPAPTYQSGPGEVAPAASAALGRPWLGLWALSPSPPRPPRALTSGRV